MFSQIFSIVILCMSLNHNKSPLQVKTPSFDTYNVNTPTEPQTINKPTEPEKVVPLFQKPNIELVQNTDYKYSLKIYNPNNFRVKLYVNNSTNGTEISPQSYTTYKGYWDENQTTIDFEVYFKNDNGAMSDTTIITINRPQTKLQAPTYEILKNTYDEYKIKITNPNDTNAILYCDSGQNLYEQDIAANDWISFTEGWDGMGNDTTITAYFYKNGGAYANSDTITINITRPVVPLFQKPRLELTNNTNTSYSFRIYNDNSVRVDCYINSTYKGYIDSGDYFAKTDNWGENQTTIDILIYFEKKDGAKSDDSILTINRPQTKLQAPTYEIIKNDYDEYKIKITNPNNTNAILYCNSEQDLYEQDIAANDWIAFTEGWDGMGNETTITAYFYKNGGAYTNSDTITINLTRPSAPNYLSGGYGTYNYIPNTHKYEITIENTNPVAVNYTDNFSNNFTIQANTTTKISVQLTPTQEDLTINGTFTPTGGNYQKTNFDLKINSIHYIDITSISRQPNGNITIKYKDAQPINSNKWSLDIKDDDKYTNSINLDIKNTEGSLTIENQPASKLYLTIFYGINIVEKKTLDEVKTENEIVDIPSIMLLILTLPFSFLSQAFNLTLFAGTQYAFNAADIILTIVGAIIIFYIIKLIIKIIKLF